MKQLKVKIVNKSKHPLPEYAKFGDAGMDLRANLEHSIVLEPNSRCLVPTDIYIELPLGYEAQIRSRSGLALKSGLFVLNSPGTIDHQYRGAIGIILFNTSNDMVFINDGDRIAQMVVKKHETVQWVQVDKLSDTDRGEGGFGHSGIK